MRRRPTFGSLKWARGLALGLSLLATFAHDAPAQDPIAAARDLETSDDFRVRVSAALTLGRSHAPGARTALEHALNDAHPAVRTAAAAGLAALGDRDALVALRLHLASESSTAARAQIAASIASLENSAVAPDVNVSPEQRWQNTRDVVALGDMHNRSEVHGTHASEVLRAATRVHARSIPGALVSDGNDAAMFQQAAERHVPVFQLDGALQRLAVGQKNTELSYNAQVDYSMRRMPEQQLRGTLSGSATSFGSVSALRDPGMVMMLEDQAIDAAVESALRGAARGFGAPSR